MSEARSMLSQIPGGCSYYDVPTRLARPFHGREDVLAQVYQCLTGDSNSRVVVIQAMGGQGKSQVALEYCRRKQKDGFSAIFWIDTSSENTIQGSFWSIYERIKSLDL